MKRTLILALVAVALLSLATPSFAQQKPPAQQSPQRMELTMDGVGTISAPLQVVVLMTLLSFVPAILMTMTSFTRIVIVFHFMRQAIGTQEVPNNQILVGLALFLTMFIMAPVGTAINDLAVQPAMAGKISAMEAVERATPPLRGFMLKQTRETDLAMFIELSKTPKPAKSDDLPMRVVIPAYVMSEIKTGFQMGFFVFIPFLLIDLVVSTSLLSMGMMQLPPAMISLPFKLVLFVTVDGWSLVVKSLVRSFA
ncbi:MAG: flagellar type III secretion system pore protein FliP [Acidobacteriota bacterium]